jgi:hypothetical protein
MNPAMGGESRDCCKGTVQLSAFAWIQRLPKYEKDGVS